MTATRGHSIDRATNGFSKQRRLLTSSDFDQVFKRVAVKAGTGELFLLASPSLSEHAPRLGFIIARKEVKRAVDRNRIKRIVREEFRTLGETYPDLDIIVMARRGAQQLSRQATHDAAQYLFRKLSKRYAQ